jgi:osmotically-inducible protein OsmY
MFLLEHSPIPALRVVEVTETDQAIELSGVLRTYYHKQLAQTAVSPMAGGRHIVNNIRVAKRLPHGAGG